MKKFIPFMTIVLMAAMYSCAQTKKSSTVKTAAAPPITSLTLMRGGCFGRCPIYDITVESNGMATYTGKMFTPDSGIYRKNIGAAKANLILKNAMDNRIDTCAAEYENMVPDLPGINFEYVANGKTEHIFNAHFGPVFLKQLANLIDKEIKKDNSWTRTGDYKPKY